MFRKFMTFVVASPRPPAPTEPPPLPPQTPPGRPLSVGERTPRAPTEPSLHDEADAPHVHHDEPVQPRVALITGAAQGIGLAIAHRLADDGFSVAINDIESKSDALEEAVELLRFKGRKALAIVGDVSQEQDVQNMVDRTVEELGGLDVMVANAGISPTCPLAEISVDEWDNVMAVNVRGVMLCYRIAATQMIAEGRGGKLIAATSVLGKKGMADVSAYAASKFAIRGLTQSAAHEYAKHGITVNAYAPGVIQTPMIDELDDAVGERMNIPKGAFVKAWVAKDVPLGRIGTPQDVANFVSFLASPDSDYITGAGYKVISTTVPSADAGSVRADLVLGQSISVDGGINFD